MYSIIPPIFLSTFFFLQTQAYPQSTPQTNITKIGNAINFENLITDRIVALCPATPNIQIKYIIAEPWNEATSSNAEDFLRIKLLYYSPVHKQFSQTIYDPWKPDVWSDPTASDPSWSNCKPFRWSEVSSVLYGQLLELKKQGIDREYTSVRLQKLRSDYFDTGNDQMYWIWETHKGGDKYWQGDVDHKAYTAYAPDKGQSTASEGRNVTASDVEELTATS